MIPKRKRISYATVEASTDSYRNILAKRLVMVVKYVAGINPKILSIESQGIKTRTY